ncbi:tautomerase family protein [Conyzicola nivalis]|uniref:Tautomerase YusQ n=1 Tax=Conyzicola nivalis TaxID=1477021 RepID=A0A916WEQ1_9MICO|nr:tautomerase family protein [Conyzicola nivalis]GGA91004.1 putative tautomerase YusQ [Conyzicola nivalis]
MPLVRIDLPAGTPAGYKDSVVEVVYRALVDVAHAPENDKFFVVTEHGAAGLVMDPHYFVDRSGAALIIQIVFNAGRTVEVKKALYRAIAVGLSEKVGLRTEDVFINLVEVPKENWSFGLGEAQYAE